MPDRLDAVDFVVLNFDDRLQASLLDDPLFARSGVVRRGDVVVLDRIQTNAGVPVSPPSMPFVVDALADVLRA